MKEPVQGVDYPKCYESRKQWDEWKQSARACLESCNICHDCTDAYRHEMQLQERCDRKTWWGFAAKTRRGEACTTN